MAGLDAAEPLPRQAASVLSGIPAADSAHTAAHHDSTAAMRIRTDTAASTASLTDYLQRCGCIVAVIDRRIIEVTAKPDSFAAPHADVELEGYLSVWQAMHPEALLERPTSLTPP